MIFTMKIGEVELTLTCAYFANNANELHVDIDVCSMTFFSGSNSNFI